MSGEIPYAVLLWGIRIAFLVLLYLFLLRSFAALWRAMGASARAAAAPVPAAQLVVVSTFAGGPKAGERLPLLGLTSIGREVTNDLVVADEAASARHAVIEFADGDWWVEDAGSTNGTFLNGAPTRGRERLRTGDELAVGRVVLRLER